MSICSAPAWTHHLVPKVNPESEMTAFGLVMEELLEERHWKQEALSEATEPHVSQGQISNYKYGRRKPMKGTVRSIARAFVKGLSEEQAEKRYPDIVDRLLAAAGFQEDFRGVAPIDSLIAEAGFDYKIFSGEERAQIQESFRTIVAGTAARQIQKQGRD